MLSFLYAFVKSSVGVKSASLRNQETEREMNSAISRIEDALMKEAREHTVQDSPAFKTGNVTFVSTDYVLIDDYFVYETGAACSGLKIGDKIHFRVSSDEKQPHKVTDIVSGTDENWDKRNGESRVSSVIGKVVERKNRLLIVEPNKINVDLNRVRSDFVPVIGDWLRLESEVEINENEYNLSGEILEIKRIQPLRSKLRVASVSSFDPVNGIGVIGEDTVFNKRICDPGYAPRVGDKVVSDSIESDQGVYKWRALSVVPMLQVSTSDTKSASLFPNPSTKKNFPELIQDKCGVTIDGETTVTLNASEEKLLTLTVTNSGIVSQTLRKCCFLTKKSQSQLTLINPSSNAFLPLNPTDSVEYVFECSARFVGSSEEFVVFKFKGFEIGRKFTVNVKPKLVDRKKFAGRAEKVGGIGGNSDEWNDAAYIPGIRPYKPPFFVKVRNAVFRVPKCYWKIVARSANEGKSETECAYDVANAVPCLSARLRFESYRDRFHALLYLEEIARTADMQRYSLASAVMRRCGEYLAMTVPGLAEKRPSLLVGDRAVVSFDWDSSHGKLKYEGYIHKVSNQEIFLKFNQSFHESYNNEDCRVSFKCSHTALQRCHNAINLSVNRLGESILFPDRVIEKESQVDLIEPETTLEPTLVKRSAHKRNNSLSSDSSNSSNKSSAANKSFTKMSVVQRLFNVNPVERNTETAIESRKPETRIDSVIELSKNRGESDEKKGEAANESANVEIASELQPIISRVKRRKLVWFRNDLNRYQKEAVKNILKGHARPLPYVIFGPPGTGKTVTLCEAILQIMSTIPESRLLVATPSNSSANLIAERLLDSGVLKPGDMVRIVAHHCLSTDTIPHRLLPYCATADLSDESTIGKRNQTSVGPRLNCTISVLGRHRITIGTCIALGVLNNIGFPRGHFSHVLVDEAGQATEPEIMVPLNFVHSDSGQLILAGDPLQLGPVVQSRIAKIFGLDESFLSRLLRYFPYQRDPSGFDSQYDPRVVTKLVVNYRSLPEILELSSSLFYDSELKATVSSKSSREAKLLEKLGDELPERKGSPPAVIFHGVNGENCRDEDSPSWYNPEEATQVCLYLLKLYKCGVEPEDVGIIAPYQKQVSQIRDLLMELDTELPKISSVEGFQGQERDVIIISAVRSASNFVEEDIKHSLGFVACPRRLNVAITRARALLIILGNPKLLARDPYWRSVLIYCVNRNSYTGCSFGFDETVEDENDDCDVDDGGFR